jgi:hypothetical protein
MAATIEQIKSLAELGTKVITLQLLLASKEADDAMQNIWALGYCFGVFDALGRRAKLDQYTDGLAVITVGFSLLTDREAGAIHLGRALDLQTEQAFFEGNNEGGSEIYEWLGSKAYKPLALMNHLTFGRPVPRTGS